MAREIVDGPVKVRLNMLMYRKSEGQARLIEKSWVVECSGVEALDHFRERFREFMRGMDGTVLIRDAREPSAER